MFAALFVLLTLAGAAWALSRATITRRDLAMIAGFPVPLLTLLFGLCISIYLTDLLRYRSVGNAVGTAVPWRAGLDASVANFFFSWITPGSTFGVPATIYVLGRRGVPWDATVAIAFGKSFTGVAVVVLASLVFVALGLGPDYDASLLGIVIFGGAMFALLFGLLFLAALRPQPAQRVVAAVFSRLPRRLRGGKALTSVETVTTQAIDRLARLRSGGAWPFAHIVATHILYFGSFAGVGLVLLHGFGCEVGVRSFAAVVIYIAFTYIAPTPGGAGFAEAMAIPFFGPLLPAERAVMFVLCFRGLTLYLQVGFAIPYMLIVGGGRELVARAAARERRDD